MILKTLEMKNHGVRIIIFLIKLGSGKLFEERDLENYF